MGNIHFLETNRKFKGDVSDLKSRFNVLVEKFAKPTTYHNSEAPNVWIIRGLLDYFDTIGHDFLGDSSYPGIPNAKVDQFANNIWRLRNTIKYMSGKPFWNVDIDVLSNDFDLLIDIRTVIVHSEQTTCLKFEGLHYLNDYKDIQLGSILKPRDMYFNKHTDYDYCITLWSDKHSKEKKKHMTNNDFDEINQLWLDIDIYIKAEDIRDIALNYLSDFIDLCEGKEITHSFTKISNTIIPVVDRFEDTTYNGLTLLARKLNNEPRFGYNIEHKAHYWDGFGLERFYNHVSNKSSSGTIPEDVSDYIKHLIQERIMKFCEMYDDESIDDDEIISLNVISLFRGYIYPDDSEPLLSPYYAEKLFEYIVPYYNARYINKIHCDADFDYLCRFIQSDIYSDEFIRTHVSLKQDAYGIVSDFIIACVMKSMISGK